MRRLAVTASAVFLAMANVAWSQPPTSLADVPVFTGAVLDNDATRQAADQAQPADIQLPMLDSYLSPQGKPSLAIYASAAAPEEVFNWYKKQLGAVPEPEDGPGAPGSVTYALNFWDPDADFATKEVADGVYSDGKLMKRSVESRPAVDGQWINGGGFSWFAMTSKSTGAVFRIDLEDSGFSYKDGKQRYSQKTIITLTSMGFKGYPKWDATAHSQGLSDSQIERLEALYDTPPTQADLGAPAYPDAQLDFDLLVRNPTMIGMNIAYTSQDAPDKVMAFYQAATGKKFAKDKQAYGIVLSGGTILSVQSAGSTLIMFTKTAR
jgi:hypothetical protein